MRRILVIGGGSDLQPRLRRTAPDVLTVSLCRISVLRWVHEPQENQAIVALADDASLETWLKAARAIQADFKVDTVATLAEIDQDKAAAIALDLGLECHSPETVRSCHDKSAMRDSVQSSGVEDLPHRVVESVEELNQFLREVGPPLILKPSKGRASAGIAIVRSEADTESAFAVTSTAEAPRLETSPPLAERFIEGPEFSVETVSVGDEHYIFAVTEKFSDPTTRVETGHVVPARIDAATSRQIVAHVRACLKALGVRQGVTHTEVILGANGPVLVETHLRQAGDEIIDLVEHATGVDINDLALKQLVGFELADLPEIRARHEGPQYTGAGAIRYLAPDLTGLLVEMDGLDRAGAIEGVRKVSQLVEDGTELHGLRSSYSRLASVRVAAEDADAAVDLAKCALEELSVRIKESP